MSLPSMIMKFTRAEDLRAAEILEVIYKDEIDHVRIGSFWYQPLCDERKLNSTQTFSDLGGFVYEKESCEDLLTGPLG